MSLKQEKTENKNEIKLTFTVESKKFEDAIIKVYNENAKYFNIPGFRKEKHLLKLLKDIMVQKCSMKMHLMN